MQVNCVRVYSSRNEEVGCITDPSTASKWMNAAARSMISQLRTRETKAGFKRLRVCPSQHHTVTRSKGEPKSHYRQPDPHHCLTADILSVSVLCFSTPSNRRLYKLPQRGSGFLWTCSISSRTVLYSAHKSQYFISS